VKPERPRLRGRHFPIYPLRSPTVIKLYKSTDSFVYAQTSLMSFEALKQYFRSRHGKTSYTEEELSTLFFFLRMASPENLQDTATNMIF
jgi:hypothetical protein